MTRLTRRQTLAALQAAGWPLHLQDTMVAIAAAESSLRVEVVGPKNANGTEDYGLWQINSVHVANPPYFSRAKLLSDPTYNASAAKWIFDRQGLKAWVAYGTGAYRKYMPPPVGPALQVGSVAWFLVADLQQALNAAGANPALITDGAFGPKTEAALVAYQQAHPVEPKVAGPVYWKMLVP